MKYLLLFASTFLFLTKPVDAQWTQLGADIDGEALADKSGYSVSMADSNNMAIGAIYNDDNGLESGQEAHHHISTSGTQTRVVKPILLQQI